MVDPASSPGGAIEPRLTRQLVLDRDPGATAPERVVNVHVDHQTFVDLLTEAELLPERAGNPFDTTIDTDPDNGDPRCLRHNLTKNRGFTVWRDPRGDWHTYRPDGTEVA